MARARFTTFSVRPDMTRCQYGGPPQAGAARYVLWPTARSSTLTEMATPLYTLAPTAALLTLVAGIAASCTSVAPAPVDAGPASDAPPTGFASTETGGEPSDTCAGTADGGAGPGLHDATIAANDTAPGVDAPGPDAAGQHTPEPGPDAATSAGSDGGAADTASEPNDDTPDAAVAETVDSQTDVTSSDDTGGDAAVTPGVPDDTTGASEPTATVCDPGWVTLTPAGLRIDGELWVPRMLDYRVTVRVADDSRFMAPQLSSCTGPVDCGEALAQDLALAAEIGFDAVRFAGLPWAHGDDGIALGCEDPCMPIEPGTDAGGATAVAVLEDLLVAADAAGLKAMIVLREPLADPTALAPGESDWLGLVGAAFASDPTLFAYDIAPLPGDPTLLFGFDKAPRLAGLQARYDALRAGTPTQLVTATIRGTEAAIDWDPGLLPVDLVGLASFPPQEAFESDARLSYEREAVWLAGVDAPWLFTSTGLATSGGATESDQHAVALRAHELVRDCGGLGVGWFRLRDATEGYGLARPDGSLKPASAVFATFDSSAAGSACPTLAELATDQVGPGFLVTGRVLSALGVPLEGVVVVGWSCVDPADRCMAVTGSDGRYDLHTAAAVSHVAISTHGHETLEQLWTGCSSIDLGDRILGAFAGPAPVTSPPACEP